MLPIRVDRAVTVYGVLPLLRLLRVGRSSIPILMYHSVSAALNAVPHPGIEFLTEPEDKFRLHASKQTLRKEYDDARSQHLGQNCRPAFSYYFGGSVYSWNDNYDAYC
jgi:hypothetical protein